MRGMTRERPYPYGSGIWGGVLAVSYDTPNRGA
jgi:hypothetical protein